jgi:serine/threonine protein kinase
VQARIVALRLVTLATADAIRLSALILDALDYAHKHGVTATSRPPFVQDDGAVKVADFGIAHVDSSSLTQAWQVMGTPSSMSPEQILGLPVDGRTDVFSAGVILYQFVTGERPFGGVATTTTMQKVLKEDPLPPSTLNGVRTRWTRSARRWRKTQDRRDGRVRVRIAPCDAARRAGAFAHAAAPSPRRRSKRPSSPRRPCAPHRRRRRQLPRRRRLRRTRLRRGRATLHAQAARRSWRRARTCR